MSGLSFNTTLVKVLCKPQKSKLKLYVSFNTTLVKVLLLNLNAALISSDRFNTTLVKVLFLSVLCKAGVLPVSIQLLLRFYEYPFQYFESLYVVSIQLLLRFYKINTITIRQ